MNGKRIYIWISVKQHTNSGVGIRLRYVWIIYLSFVNCVYKQPFVGVIVENWIVPMGIFHVKYIYVYSQDHIMYHMVWLDKGSSVDILAGNWLKHEGKQLLLLIPPYYGLNIWAHLATEKTQRGTIIYYLKQCWICKPERPL